MSRYSILLDKKPPEKPDVEALRKYLLEGDPGKVKSIRVVRSDLDYIVDEMKKERKVRLKRKNNDL